MIAGGINWMASRMPKGTRIRSSKYPRTGMKSGMRSIGERITSDEETHRLRVPRHARVPARKAERMHILFDDARPILQLFDHYSHYHDSGHALMAARSGLQSENGRMRSVSLR